MVIIKNMKDRTEISILLIGIIVCALIGFYFEVNKKAISDNAYIHCFKEQHPEIPIEEITVPAQHDFSFLENSMHIVALIWFATSIFGVISLSIIIYRKKRGKRV